LQKCFYPQRGFHGHDVLCGEETGDAYVFTLFLLGEKEFLRGCLDLIGIQIGHSKAKNEKKKP